VVSVRVTRDRRGYDHVYLVEETRRRGRPEGRLLYWSRLPGGLRVGRELFDAETRAAIEQANPGISFDWPSLLKNVSASVAAARWSARQQQQRPPGQPPSGQQPAMARGDRGRPASMSGPRRSWREDDDEIPNDAEGPLAPVSNTAQDARGSDPAGSGDIASRDEPPTV
jgi:hypothetical protein